MAKLIRSSEYFLDLQQIATFLEETGTPGSSILRTINEIENTVQKLSEYPELGNPFPFRIIETTYRHLIVGKYVVFYYLENENVCVDRVFDTRMDYISLLL